MNSAMLHNGKIISAKEYNSELHGSRIYCIDSKCKSPMIFIPQTETTMAYFKTTGKNQSIHTAECGFFKALDFHESINKVSQYQTELKESGIKETIISLNLNSIDPDYEKKVIDKEEAEKKDKDPSEIKVKKENEPPKTITSLKSVVKLITSYEPDLLAGVLISFKGNRIPLSQLILSHEQAHELLWSDRAIDKLQYFVYGTIEKVVRREKVIYINFKSTDSTTRFSLVVFDRYFKHFTLSDNELIDKAVLVAGSLRKNTFNDKNTTEMIVKSNKYLSNLPKQN